MKASEGNYYPRLDHVRAFAAFLVFFWHFVHSSMAAGDLVPSLFFLSVFEEGWTGVGLFMTLSGYLFAKILEDREMIYRYFFWNRLIRIGPLLVIVLVYCLIFRGYDFKPLLKGFVLPTWPLACWSISVELHFYIIFPVLICIARKFGLSALVLSIILFISVRWILFFEIGQVQTISYWTIGGRIDQFVIGMLISYCSKSIIFNKYAMITFCCSFLTIFGLFHYLNTEGGFQLLGGRYPSPSPLWIFLPTIEGALWGSIIASYEKLNVNLPNIANKAIARVGEVSYSIYMWHLVVLTWIQGVFRFPENFFLASCLTIVLFVPIVFISIVSFEMIEKPFLRFRVKYVLPSRVGSARMNPDLPGVAP